MKINRIVVFLVFVFLFTSCSSNDRSNRKQDAEGGGFVQKNERPAEHEDFYQFLDKFSTKRIFQLERIIFPITVSAPDANQIALAPTEEEIEKMDWELLDLSYDSTYTTRDFDKYTQTVNFRKDTAHVALRGIDNGIYADYYFKLINGKWYLVTLSE
ncbi:MAG: DUF4348 domain-containing protein [Petrimonas sp.]|uniref:DUF4348 domain-containing protein n=1 Tax=Petrimonas sp. TaxID=2023866 RepID=UPI001BD53E78|nr:DUF4348 domain-containing protein [Petrimonas sp.]MEA5064328.1 DUF4348 domain-containing protein [Petrimonas sp.]